MVKSLPAMQEAWIQSLGREDPLEKEMAIYNKHYRILAWGISRIGVWQAIVHGIAKSQTRLSD